MEKILKKYEDIALSNTDLMNIIKGKAHVVLYPQLVKYSNIDDVLGKYGAAFILFCAKPQYGHWCLIFKTPNSKSNTLEFFNPYGGFPDDSLTYIPMNYRVQSNQFHTILSKMLYDSPYQLTYNEFPFQAKGYNIKTCGRWCAVRLFWRHLNLYDFKDMIDDLCYVLDLDPDELVTLLTMHVNKNKSQ